MFWTPFCILESCSRFLSNLSTNYRGLRASEEGRSFSKEGEESGEYAVAEKDKFIETLIAVMSPSRNYHSSSFATSELLYFSREQRSVCFSQYGADVCRQANPTGVIGLCNALICGFRRRDGLYDEELRPLRDLCSDRQAQCSLWFPWTSTVRLEGRGMYFPFYVRYIFHVQDSRAFSHDLMEYKGWRDI